MDKNFAKYFAPFENDAERDAYFKKNVSFGFRSGYEFITPSLTPEPLILNPGLTLICGAPGNGKTSFLINLALLNAEKNMLEKTGKKVYVLSYEVPKAKFISDCLNTYLNRAKLFNPEKHNSPIQAIRAYLRDHDSNHFASGMLDFFTAKYSEFSRKYLYSGTLNIQDCHFDVKKLTDAIEYISDEGNPSFVAIDYIQLLELEGSTQGRVDDLRRITGALREISIKKNLTIIAATQLNRGGEGLTNLVMNNIAESIDLARVCDKAVGVYLPSNMPAVFKKEELKAAVDIYKRFNLPIEYDSRGNPSIKPVSNKIYATLMKNRDGTNHADMMFDWCGATKHIKMNSKLVEEKPLTADSDDDL